MAEPASPSLPLPPPLPHLPASLAHNLLLSPVWCHGACGKQVAGGTIIPGLGMVLVDERGSGTGTTPLPAQPLLLSEVLQEGQDSLSDPLCSQVQAGRVEQRHSTGWLERGEQLPLFLFPDNMWAVPVCWPCLQPGSSPCPAPAGSVLLPCRLSLSLSSVHCSFMHWNIQACCPRECLERGRCCS